MSLRSKLEKLESQRGKGKHNKITWLDLVTAVLGSENGASAEDVKHAKAKLETENGRSFLEKFLQDAEAAHEESLEEQFAPLPTAAFKPQSVNAEPSKDVNAAPITAQS